MDKPKETICELEDRLLKLTSQRRIKKRKKEKKNKEKKVKTHDVWNTTKRNNLWITKIPEEKKWRKNAHLKKE